MSIVAKSLADGQLPNSIGTLYTVPTATKTVIKEITITNTDSSARTINLYITRSGSTPRRIIPKDMSLGIGYTTYPVDDNVITLSDGDTIDGDASASSVCDYLITGVEEA